MSHVEGAESISRADQLSEAKRRLRERYLLGNLQERLAGPRGITQCPASGSTPLSYEQEERWFQAQRLPGIPLGNESHIIHRSGPLEVGALERSFDEFIRRHAIWRTTFVEVDGRPVAVVHAAPATKFPLVDLSGIPASDQEAQILWMAAQDVRRPFDFVRGPLLRATLVRLGDTDHRLLITLNQIIFDCVSMYNVFLPELVTLYEAFSTGQPSKLQEPPLQYVDYARWQRQELDGPALESQMEYWRHRLAGAPTSLELPTDRPRPATQTFGIAQKTIRLPIDLIKSLRALSQGERVTLFVTLLSSFATLLYRYTRQQDILVGALTTTRKQMEVQGVMGLFLHTSVLRTDLSGDPSFRELLRRIREVTLEALSNDDLPFARVLKELQPEPDPARHPLFQVMFVLGTLLPTPPPGWKLTRMDIEFGATKFDLYVDLDETTDGITGRFMYSSDLFEAATVARMVEDWQTLLEDMAANPNQPISELPLSLSIEQPEPTEPEVGPDPEDGLGTPRSLVEQALAEIWTQVLGVEQVSIHDNFFDLGGESLAAARVIDGLEKRLGVRLHLRELIFQTLGQLAADCEGRLARMNRLQS